MITAAVIALLIVLALLCLFGVYRGGYKDGWHDASMRAADDLRRLTERQRAYLDRTKPRHDRLIRESQKHTRSDA